MSSLFASNPKNPVMAPAAYTRLGAVSYLNTKPLIYGLEASLGNHAGLQLQIPSRLADELHVGEIDVGLIPVVESFGRPMYSLVSDAVIACRGPVWSVRIFFRCEPSQVRSLALDMGSRTSVALSKVLFHARFGKIPATKPLPMDEDPREVEADAVLVIGDRAMHPEWFRPSFTQDWDLGQVWFEETGLPFVFAMWVARDARFATEWLTQELQQARDMGLAQVDGIAEQCAHDYQLSTSQCKDYLANYLRFYLRDEERRGLEEFRRRCSELKLVQAT